MKAPKSESELKNKENNTKKFKECNLYYKDTVDSEKKRYDETIINFKNNNDKLTEENGPKFYYTLL